MPRERLALGLDSSTQSLSAVVIDIDTAEKCFEHSLDYRADARLNHFGIGEDYILPPREEGEAEQPPLMYLASLDALFADMREAGIPLENISLINTSGQQHGHVYLNRDADTLLAQLTRPDAVTSSLQILLKDAFAYPNAPIWMTANTTAQTEAVRNGVGGKAKMIDLSGSDAPLRFTGTVVRRVGEQFPECYTATAKVQLISSFIPAVLTGNADVPIDYGNGCGMSLMNYRGKVWDPALLAATAEGLPGGVERLPSKLPSLARPDSIVGSLAAYYVEKYGFDGRCAVIAGSGDNPQSKVPVAGDLLSLGTSFVNMVSTDGDTLDPEGFANAMYDGINRPFMFGCRTNGAMVWDAVRSQYGLSKEEYAPAEAALQTVAPGEFMTFWQPKTESFPVSGAFERIRATAQSTLAEDYTGIIETSLAAVYIYSAVFTKQTQDPLFVTGGATESPEIMRRVAGIWNRPTLPVETGGAALGAAVAGVKALFDAAGKSKLAIEKGDADADMVAESFDVEAFSAVVLKRGESIQPNPADVAAYHGEGKYLQQFREKYEKIIAEHPI
ncbi:xylulose kinase [Candidatus Poribacteria bacterium]|nr:xylulose kinase [Candidatus Poribacteria bacterium]MYA58184.1 xylulose kinase [Candidatus Poribacteria bacterium]